MGRRCTWSAPKACSASSIAIAQCTGVSPPRRAPVALVLFHGYGANEQDLAPLGPMLAPALPWAALRAPLGVAPGGYGLVGWAAA